LAVAHEEADAVIFIDPRVVDVPAEVEKLLEIYSSLVLVQASNTAPAAASLIEAYRLVSFSK
jgi:hypothetical protein